MLKKIFTKKSAKTDSARITNQSLDQYRQEVLSSGRRFKYTLQYEKHKLVINGLIIGLAALVLFCVVVLWQVYFMENSSNFIYKLSQIVPLPIAKVADEPVFLNDYLTYLRSSLHYQSKNQANVDQATVDKIKQSYKSQAFDNAVKIAYAKKIARQHNLTVSSQEIEQEIDQRLIQDNTKITIHSFNQIVRDYYGLNAHEYRRVFIEYPLLIKKVMLKIDTEAEAMLNKIQDQLNDAPNGDLAELAKPYVNGEVEFIDSGLIKYRNNDIGRSAEAVKLAVGQISPVFVPRDASGYNLLKLLSKDQETLHYQVLAIPLREFDKQIAGLKEKIIIYGKFKQGE